MPVAPQVVVVAIAEGEMAGPVPGHLVIVRRGRLVDLDADALAQLGDSLVGQDAIGVGQVFRLGFGHLSSDRKSVVLGRSVSVRVGLGGGRIIKKKKQQREYKNNSKH